MPLVSIVLPTYNRAHLIAKSIDTCLNQTLKDIELIVVNDCSTDNTKAIVETYAEKDRRVKLINNEVNLRLPASLNKGFENAQGKYYTWTSDDNLYSANALEVLSETLEENSDYDLVYADYQIIDENDKVTGIAIMNDISKSFMKWVGCGSCFMYKAVVHKTNKGYDTTLFLIEDFDFFMRASLNYRFIYLNRSDLYSHRNHPGSLTSLQGHAVYEMHKILVERKQHILIPRFSNFDKKLFYRKYAVYYGTNKGNSSRMNLYLLELKKLSLNEYFKTCMYIIAKKFGSLFAITWQILKSISATRN